MKDNDLEKRVWKYRCVPSVYFAGIIIYSSICMMFLITFIYIILKNFKGLSDIISIIVIVSITLFLLFYLLYRWSKYFFILKVNKSKFSIKPKLLSFTWRFNLSETKSIEFILTRVRHIYRPNPFGSDNNSLYIYFTVSIKDVQEKAHFFNLIRSYYFRTTIKTPFIEKKKLLTTQFFNTLKDLKYLLPKFVSIRDEIKEEFETNIR